MKDELARAFWGRVDERLGTSTLKDLCVKAGINYASVRNRKSGPVYSLPRIETGYAISKALGVSVEFLLTGKEESGPFEEFLQYLRKADPVTIENIRSILHMPEKKDGSSGVKVS